MPQTQQTASLMKALVVLSIAILGVGVFMVFKKKEVSSNGVVKNQEAAAEAPQQAAEFNFAIGPDKERWMNWAISEFSKDPTGQKIRVKTVPMGALEAFKDVVKPDKKILLFSPSSSMMKQHLGTEWQNQYGNGKPPILREESLAQTPMVFLCWKERAEAFQTKYREISFENVARALSEGFGWNGIAQEPKWGAFRAGFPDPDSFNGGLVTLSLIANSVLNEPKALQLADVEESKFKHRFAATSAVLSRQIGNSGTMVRDLVMTGPSAFDFLFLYESQALEGLKLANNRSGELKIVYPKLNIYNNHPCYLLDAAWATSAQKMAANKFLNFLMSPRVQQEALIYGLRPGNASVSLNFLGSPFERFAPQGLHPVVTGLCGVPDAAALESLQKVWKEVKVR